MTSLLLGGHLFFQQVVQKGEIRTIVFLRLGNDGSNISRPGNVDVSDFLEFIGQLFISTSGIGSYQGPVGPSGHKLP
jgi:hypothetical protein